MSSYENKSKAQPFSYGWRSTQGTSPPKSSEADLKRKGHKSGGIESSLFKGIHRSIHLQTCRCKLSRGTTPFPTTGIPLVTESLPKSFLE